MDHLVGLVNQYLCAWIKCMNTICETADCFLLALPWQSRFEAIRHNHCIIVSQETHHCVSKPSRSNHTPARKNTGNVSLTHCWDPRPRERVGERWSGGCESGKQCRNDEHGHVKRSWPVDAYKTVSVFQVFQPIKSREIISS